MMTNNSHRRLDTRLDHHPRRRGASALTYGLVLGLISIGAIGTVETVGGGIAGLFEETRVGIEGGQPCAPGTTDAGLSYGEIAHDRTTQVRAPLDDLSGFTNATAAESVYTVNCDDGDVSVSDPQTVITACDPFFAPQGARCVPFAAVIEVSSASLTAQITDGVSPGPAAVVTVTNGGNTDSGLVGFSLTAGGGDFTILPASTCEDGVTVLDASASCEVRVARVATENQPSRAGSLTISFANAAADLVVSLSGAATGFAPGALSWASGDGTAMDIAGPATTSRCERFTLENTGDLTIGGLSVGLSANPGSHFALGCASDPMDDCPTSGGALPGGATCTVSAQATASANAAMSATISATATDDGDGGTPATADVALAGIATGFAAGTLAWTAGDGAAMDITGPFSSISRCETFTLTNGGDLDVSGLNFAIANNPQDYFAAGCGSENSCLTLAGNGTPLAGGATCTVSVQATASANAAMSATLRMSASDDGYGGAPAAAEVALSGTASGFDPGALNWLTGPSTDFSFASPTTASDCRTFTLENSGDLTVSGLGVSLSGTNANRYSLNCAGTDTCPTSGGTLDGGASCTASVQASASQNTSLTASLQASASDDGAGSNPADPSVGLSGTVSGYAISSAARLTRSGYADLHLIPMSSGTVDSEASYINTCRAAGYDRPGTDSSNPACSGFFGAPSTGDSCNQGSHYQNYTFQNNWGGGGVLFLDLPTTSWEGLYFENFSSSTAGNNFSRNYNDCCLGSGHTRSHSFSSGQYIVCAQP